RGGGGARHAPARGPGARALRAEERADVLDRLANVAGGPPRLLRARELEEVRQDAVQAPGLGPERRQGRGALLGGQLGLVGQERGGIEDGRERITYLVGHAGGQLARRRQPPGLAQARGQPLALAARALG